MGKPLSSDLCLPRWATPRRSDRQTLGPAVAAIADMLGQPLMPWQRQVADVGLEMLEDGRPAYRSVTFTVPRQSGKTTVILCWEIQRVLGWAKMLGQPQRVLYSAQTGKDAREKLLDDQVPLLDPNKRLLGVNRVIRTNGSEAIVFNNGSRIGTLASGADSGHGKTLDLGVEDELFADMDFRRDQAMNPAMATRPHAQKLIASTMGTIDSIALNAAVEAGRAAVTADRGRGTAYFEWSAAPEDDPASHETWWRCMPALGRTISIEVVEDAYQEMLANSSIEEFKRAYLNIPTAVEDRVIPAGAWMSVCSPTVEAVPGVFAIDCNPERTSAGIVIAGDGPTIEVVDYRPGVNWVVDRCEELYNKYEAPFAIDKTGPAGVFAEELERRRVPIVEIDARQMQHAAARFFDVVVEREVEVRSNPDLDAAVAAGAKRPVGDAWAWTRKNSRVDISLLVAGSAALWALENQPPAVAPFVLVG
jgi:hypothetical protein